MDTRAELEYEMSLTKPAVDALLNEANPTIDWQHFGEVFLPFFLKEPNPKYPTVNDNLWLTVAGSPYAAVDIIGPDGDVVATVPPKFDRGVLQVKDYFGKTEAEFRASRQARDLPIKEVLANTSLLAQNSPTDAERYMLNAFAGRVAAVSPRERRLAYARAWNNICAYYGRDLLFPELEGLPKTPEASKPVETPTEEEEYELA